MNKTLKIQIQKIFSLALAEQENDKNIFSFLQNFLSEKEFETLSKRFAITYWITKGRTKQNIKTNLKAQDKEILEAKKILEKEIIKKTIKKIEAEFWAQKKTSQIEKFLISIHKKVRILP